MSRSRKPAGFRQASAGFAFLWVLMLVALMGIGLTVGVEIYSTSVQRDKEKELLSLGRQFRQAIGQYYETQTGSKESAGKREYPASLEDLLLDNRSPSIKRHLRQIFVDPMTGKAEWGLVRVGGRIVGVHSLSIQTPIKQDLFEADDASFRSKAKYSEWVFTYPSDLLLRPDLAGSSADVIQPASQQMQLQGNPMNSAVSNPTNKP